MDTVSTKKRSEIMSKIRGKDTKPEKVVRSLLHSMGYRFRLHRKDLPGKPDIVLPKHNAIIFVHGCFWHHHEGCADGHYPKSNKSFWIDKINKTIERDKTSLKRLTELGWRTIVIWECETEDLDLLADKIRNFFDG